MVIVDSDVWSEAFRKKGKKSKEVIRLQKLIEEDEVLIIGSIRQEVFSGIKDESRFKRIKETMRAFPNQSIDDSIFELAASFFNVCRSKGIQGSHTDFLISACAVSWKAEILSKDKDFQRYSEYLPIELHKA